MTSIVRIVLVGLAVWLATGRVGIAQTLDLSGDFVEGGMVIGETDPQNSVMLDQLELIVARDGTFVFGFHRDAPARQTLTVTSPDGKVVRRVLEVGNGRYDVQRIDGLPEEQVSPPPEVLARIRSEAAMVRTTRAHFRPVTDFPDEWQWPARGRVSGVFGSQRILNGQPRAPHYGIDIALPVGTPVLAPAAGTITLVEDLYFSGVTLMIDHGHGIMSTLLHLSEVLVAPGTRVRKGQKIALSGNSGRSTGPHLDWRVNWGNHARLNAALLVPPMSH